MTVDNEQFRASSLLAEFRATLYEMYGARLERVVLSGSRARGDARPESDYDVAIFLRDMDDRFKEAYRSHCRYSLQHGRVHRSLALQRRVL